MFFFLRFKILLLDWAVTLTAIHAPSLACLILSPGVIAFANFYRSRFSHFTSALCVFRPPLGNHLAKGVKAFAIHVCGGRISSIKLHGLIWLGCPGYFNTILFYIVELSIWVYQ
jgi:ABC-type uncharacterized transport system permease subunit